MQTIFNKKTEMSDRITAFFGVIISLGSFQVWQNIMLSFIVAFIGGIAAWLAKRLCDYLSKKIHAINHKDENPS